MYMCEGLLGIRVVVNSKRVKQLMRRLCYPYRTVLEVTTARCSLAGMWPCSEQGGVI